MNEWGLALVEAGVTVRLLGTSILRLGEGLRAAKIRG